MSAKPPGTVSVERVDGRATVTWEHGPANVFDIDLLEELTRALRREEVTGAHAVILRGSGKSWSGGLSVEDHLKPRVSAMFESFHRALTTLWNLPGPSDRSGPWKVSGGWLGAHDGL